MNQILSTIRLKDRIIICSLMVVFAVLLALGIGALTEATMPPHVHSFEYHLERGEDGKFDLVGICTDEECENPVNTLDILNESESVIAKVKIESTCLTEGVMEYRFTPSGWSTTYSYEENIPALSADKTHTYVAEDTTVKDDVASVTIKCTNEGCGGEETVDISVSDLTLVETVAEATCYTPRKEIYCYNYKGTVVSFVATTVVENVPHVLNGVYVTELEIGDKVFPYGIEGVSILGFGLIGCGQSVSGSYTCEVCSQKNTVTVVREDHKYSFLADKTRVPTDINDGCAYVKCTEEDCGRLELIPLPKITVGDAYSTLVSQNQDQENQTVNYKFENDIYGFVIDENIVIPWKNHRFEFTEADVIRPTFDVDGSITLTCQNSVCSEQRVLTLPRMLEAINTTVVYYHILEKKSFTYSCPQNEYNVEYSFSYDEDWIDHTYVYSESETVKPDLLSDGIAYVRCSYEGCEKYHEIVIPKIVIEENTRIVANATEQSAAVLRYTYNNDDYGFTVTVDFNFGEPLSHDYKYSLEFTGIGFDFVGKCSQPECQEPEKREENVEVVKEEHLPTCTTNGYLLVKYERDGETYELNMTFGTELGHSYELVSETLPTMTKEGSATFVCTNDECGITETIVLPMIDLGVTAVEMPDGQICYTYNNSKYNYDLILFIRVYS